MRRIVLWCLATLVVAGAALFVLGKFYEIGAIRQHPLWAYRGLALVRDSLVAIHAADVEVPDGFSPTADQAGAALYQKHCVQCHGAPGIAPAEFALGMMPVPTNLVQAARDRDAEGIYWFIRNGLKMSGMPAWDLRMSEADIWRVTAFVEALPTLAPAEYVSLVEAAGGGADAVIPVAASGSPGPDPERGRRAMQLYACPSCHIIPGIVGPANIRVGPSLERAGARRYVAGVLPNTPENLARWIADPQEVDPLSAMPDLGVPPDLARDMAAYLYAVGPTTRPGPQPEP